MGKSAFLAVIAFLVIGAMQQMQQHAVAHATDLRDSQTRGEMLARHAALYGVEQAEQALIKSFTTDTLRGDYQDASYTTAVSVSGAEATIRAHGYATDGEGAMVGYKVVKVIRQHTTSANASGSLPSFMGSALLVNQSLTLSGSLVIDTVRVNGASGRAPSANVHTNGKLTVNGNAATIRGFGSYVTSFSGRTSRFTPYNPTSAVPVAQKASVTIPSDFAVRTAAYATSAHRVTVGHQTLSGTYDFTALGSTRAAPYVWYVGGNLTASSTATIKGYVVFVVVGNIEMSGSTVGTFGDTYPESHAAWYAGGNLTLKGNSAIWGQFYVDGDLSMSGTPKLYGNVAVRGSASISGTPHFYYVSASPSLTDLWQETTTTTTSYERVSYSEGWR